MAKKMLIDATHPEETRVVVADGNKVEEFDFESLNKRQLAGNIYLAKVTRVEPSLQAAFVDYGGNRHGFLAFSEIHPDYYQIPKADREAILAEERAYAEAQAKADEESDAKAEAAVDAPSDETPAEEEAPKKSRSRSRSRSRSKKKTETAAEDATAEVEAEAAEATPDAAAEVGVTDATPNVEDGGVITGTGAELSEAAEAQPDAADAGAESAPKAPAEGASETGAEGAADSSEDDGPVTTIAEGAGLEDSTVTDGDADDATDTSELRAADPAPEAEASEPADAPKERAEPMGMETVDLDPGEDDNAVDPLDGPGPVETAETAEADAPAETPETTEKPARRSRSRSRKKASASEKDDTVETVADDDEVEDIRPVRKPRPRKFKIQEVVKVRQIMLVQVVKEERGNKGAALTTYLSLAGRYCVLMPNTARGGGISRKITNAADRKKLKEIAQEIDVPQGAGLIVRTAGAKRTKTEIKRDYEYLQRQWEQVRELTLKSIAPAPIYEEGNLIHRSIRDYYSRDIDEVIVDGEAGYRQAKDYMKLIMPSHAKNVKLHEAAQPLFAKQGVETYLNSMFNPTVQLKSGGYIVIGITEALVAVDVNSGKATKEGSIEETALKTNLEAAEEVARQAKLRDLAGLIVIDFIDMDERKNNLAVEKRLKDALKHDRARIQVGRISGFGLLEMSRQRLRPGMLEATTQPCAHCHGTGLIRSDDSIALQVLRALEEEGGRRRSREVTARLPVKVANYLINEKREHLASIEQRFSMAVRIEADPALVGDEFPPLEKSKTATRIVPAPVSNVVGTDTTWMSDEEDAPEVVEEAELVEATPEDRAESEDEAPKKKRRRRSRRKKGANGDAPQADAPEGEGADGQGADSPEAEAAEPEAAPAEAEAPVDATPAEEKPKSRSRSRSRSRKKAEALAEDAPADTAAEPPVEKAAPAEESAPVIETKSAVDAPDAAAEPAAEEKPKRRTRARAKAPAPEPSPAVVEAATAADAAQAEPAPTPEPEPAEASPEPAVAEPAVAEADAAPSKPKKRGWWSFGN